MHIFEVPADVGDHHVPRRKLNGGVARLEKPFCHTANYIARRLEEG